MMNNIITQEEKTFFSPGQIVRMKQELPNAPTMVVYRIERSIMRNTKIYFKRLQMSLVH